MIILVCGGREYPDAQRVIATLDIYRPDLVIQGGARGADYLAKEWARMRGVHCATVPAMWACLGPVAGAYRNAAMLSLRPDRVIAFPGGRGTADMVAKARARGVPVHVVPERTNNQGETTA